MESRFASQTSSTEAAGAHAEEPAREEAVCAAVDEGVQEEAELAGNIMHVWPVLVLLTCPSGMKNRNAHLVIKSVQPPVVVPPPPPPVLPPSAMQAAFSAPFRTMIDFRSMCAFLQW